MLVSHHTLQCDNFRFPYFQGDLIGGTMADILPILVFGITSVVAGILALLLPETRNKYMPENIHDMQELA